MGFLIIFDPMIRLFNIILKTSIRIQIPLLYHGLDTQADTLFCLEIHFLTLAQSSIAAFQCYFEWVNANDIIQFAEAVSFMMWH